MSVKGERVYDERRTAGRPRKKGVTERVPPETGSRVVLVDTGRNPKGPGPWEDSCVVTVVNK